jgi:hypothetical protein
LWQGWLHAIEDAGVGVAAEIAETVAFVEELSRWLVERDRWSW